MRPTSETLFLCISRRLSARSPRIRLRDRSANAISSIEGSELLLFDSIRKMRQKVGEDVTYVARQQSGKKDQALLMAPNPESIPRMMVPSTMSRDNRLIIISKDERVAGIGMYESKRRYSSTGMTLAASLKDQRRVFWSL